MPPSVLKFDWVVNIQPVGDGQAVLKHLAPYVYRVAICDNRIASVGDQGVTYRVKPSGKRTCKTRRLDGESFVRAFAQHILPPRFRKVRYYGFMSPNCKLQLTDARWLVWLWRGWTYWLASATVHPEPIKRESMRCERCGGELELRRRHRRSRTLALASATSCPAGPTGTTPNSSAENRSKRMTSESQTSRAFNDVAARDAASGLRGRRKSTSDGSFKVRVTPGIEPIAAATGAVISTQTGPTRLRSASLTANYRAKSTQNPTRFLAASGLLEQRI